MSPAEEQPSSNFSFSSTSALSSLTLDSWFTLTSKALWKALNEEMRAYFRFDMNLDNMDSVLNVHNLQRCSLLRSFCQKTGIQLRLREYFSEGAPAPYFLDEDVLNVFPIAKHINPRASDAYNFYTTGQSKIQQGYLKDG